VVQLCTHGGNVSRGIRTETLFLTGTLFCYTLLVDPSSIKGFLLTSAEAVLMLLLSAIVERAVCRRQTARATLGSCWLLGQYWKNLMASLHRPEALYGAAFQ